MAEAATTGGSLLLHFVCARAQEIIVWLTILHKSSPWASLMSGKAGFQKRWVEAARSFFPVSLWVSRARTAPSSLSSARTRSQNAPCWLSVRASRRLHANTLLGTGKQSPLLLDCKQSQSGSILDSHHLPWDPRMPFAACLSEHLEGCMQAPVLEDIVLYPIST